MRIWTSGSRSIISARAGTGRSRTPTIEDLLDHIDHAVKVAGIDHVGLGADMYPRTPTLEGIRGAQDYVNITRGLKRRGYSDEDVRKIMGGNFLRVWKQVTG